MSSTLLLVVYLIFFVICIGIALWLVQSLIHMILGNAPFVPVQDHALSVIINELELNDESVFIDIGCGNAKVLVAASRQFPNTKMIGIEYSIIPYLLALWNTRTIPTISIVRNNLFAYDFSRATHLYAYLFPNMMPQLYRHLSDQVAPGTMLISCDFKFAEKQPVKTIDLLPGQQTLLSRKLYMYRW